MTRTIVIRREYLHFVRFRGPRTSADVNGFLSTKGVRPRKLAQHWTERRADEKRHKTLSAHCSPAYVPAPL